MTTEAIYERFQLRARQAHLSKTFSPHDSRRTWVGNLLNAGADIAPVQQMAGHESVATTARYDRRGEGAKRKAANLLHFPWGEQSQELTLEDVEDRTPSAIADEILHT